MPWISARTVIEEPEASEEYDRLCIEHDRFGEVFEAIKWLLARHCDRIESLKRINKGVEYSLYRFGGDPVAETPDVTVLFTYDDNEVTLIAIRAEKATIIEE